MGPPVPDHPLTVETSSRGSHGDPALLVEAARTRSTPLIPPRLFGSAHSSGPTW